MRDSALKPSYRRTATCSSCHVGEELMRDSALKLQVFLERAAVCALGRRRAHARQRFETKCGHPERDAPDGESEKSSCATAL